MLLLTGGAVYSPALTDFTFMVKVRASPLLSVVFCVVKVRTPQLLYVVSWLMRASHNLNFFLLFRG